MELLRLLGPSTGNKLTTAEQQQFHPNTAPAGCQNQFNKIYGQVVTHSILSAGFGYSVTVGAGKLTRRDETRAKQSEAGRLKRMRESYNVDWRKYGQAVLTMWQQQHDANE